MAKKSTTPVAVPVTTAPVAATTATEPNKAQSIRDYASANPNAKPADVVKALAAKGIEVSASRVSTVLAGGKKKAAVDVEGIKAAAAFLKQYEGSIENAADAIRWVGQYIDQCGSSEEALAALDAYKAIADAVSSK